LPEHLKKWLKINNMKKTNTSNPLKYFNDKKDEAYKKAGGEMAAFKKSLNRMDNGGIQTNGDSEDMMINKPGYGAKKNVYTRPEPTPAAKNAVYQGPVSDQAMYEISRNARANPGMDNFNAVRAKEIENASRNPKNSEIQEKGNKSLTSRKLSKEAKKIAKQDYKNLPSNSPQKKESRQVLAQVIGSAIAGPFAARAFGKQMEKKKGGSVKSKKK
jgi:hypothetical protein